MMPFNHLILCRPCLLLPSFFPSIRVFSSESTLRIRWLKYWSFSFSISPSNEYSGLISFRIYWFDLLAVQGTLKILLQHHSSNASVLWHSAFFTVHFSHLYMTTGKNHSFYYKDVYFSFFSHLFIYVTYSCLLTHSDSDNDNGCINQGKTRKRELMPDSVLERICWVGQKICLGFL